MDCPVCQTTGLSESTSTCPQCKTDLGAIQMIHKAQRAYSEQKKQKSLWMLLAFVFAFIFIVSLFLPAISGKKVSKSEYVALNEQLVTALNDLTQSKLEVEKLVQEVAAARTAQQEFQHPSLVYTVQWGENLSHIASAVYGDRQQYSKIVSENALQDPDLILNGQKLTIRY